MYTFSSSIRTRVVNVIVTIFTYESLKKRIAKSIMTLPWYTDIHIHTQKVFIFKLRPFYSDLYSGGKFSADYKSVSVSSTSEKTGSAVYTVA